MYRQNIEALILAVEYDVSPDIIFCLKDYPVEKTQMVHLWYQGYNNSQIARELGFSSRNVDYQIKKMGIEPNQKQTTEEEFEQMKELRQKGLSYQKIADEVGRDVATVYNKLKKEGVK